MKALSFPVVTTRSVCVFATFLVLVFAYSSVKYLYLDNSDSLTFEPFSLWLSVKKWFTTISGKQPLSREKFTVNDERGHADAEKDEFGIHFPDEANHNFSELLLNEKHSRVSTHSGRRLPRFDGSQNQSNYANEFISEFDDLDGENGDVYDPFEDEQNGENAENPAELYQLKGTEFVDTLLAHSPTHSDALDALQNLAFSDETLKKSEEVLRRETVKNASIPTPGTEARRLNTFNPPFEEYAPAAFPETQPNLSQSIDRKPSKVTDVRWKFDTSFLDPNSLKDHVTKQDVAEWANDKRLWAAFYGFDRIVDCYSTNIPGAVYRLKFTDVLGAGGQGLILAATDIDNNRNYAIKVLRLKREHQKDPGRDAQILHRRVMQEIALWKHIPNQADPRDWSDRSQLVLPLDTIQPTVIIEPLSPDTNKYSLKWVLYDVFSGDMAHMSKIIKGELPIKIEAAKQMYYSTMSLHAMGLVHSDVKMLNYFVESTGRVFLGDHALSRPVYNNSGCIDGTARYLPPENMRCILKEKRKILVSERKDSWAVGVVLYKLFCNSYPYDMRDLWSSDLFEVVGNSSIHDLDFSSCPGKTPLMVLSLIRLLLNPSVGSRPTLRQAFLHHAFFQNSNEAIAEGDTIGTVLKLLPPEIAQHHRERGDKN